MKVIKLGKPYRKHKCFKCKSTYVYHIYENKWGDLIYCPVCNNYLDFYWFDKKISTEEYNCLQELKIDNKEEE